LPNSIIILKYETLYFSFSRDAMDLWHLRADMLIRDFVFAQARSVELIPYVCFSDLTFMEESGRRALVITMITWGSGRGGVGYYADPFPYCYTESATHQRL